MVIPPTFDQRSPASNPFSYLTSGNTAHLWPRSPATNPFRYLTSGNTAHLWPRSPASNPFNYLTSGNTAHLWPRSTSKNPFSYLTSGNSAHLWPRSKAECQLSARECSPRSLDIWGPPPPGITRPAFMFIRYILINSMYIHMLFWFKLSSITPFQHRETCSPRILDIWGPQPPGITRPGPRGIR